MAHVFFKHDRKHRIFTISVPAPGVRHHHHAVASLSEMRRSSPSGPLDLHFIGDATMKVYNVSPEHDVVWVRGEIDWDDDLDILVTVLVEE